MKDETFLMENKSHTITNLLLWLFFTFYGYLLNKQKIVLLAVISFA